MPPPAPAHGRGGIRRRLFVKREGFTGDTVPNVEFYARTREMKLSGTHRRFFARRARRYASVLVLRVAQANVCRPPERALFFRFARAEFAAETPVCPMPRASAMLLSPSLGRGRLRPEAGVDESTVMPRVRSWRRCLSIRSQHGNR